VCVSFLDFPATNVLLITTNAAAEDAQDASKTVPMALLWAYCINTVMAFVMGTTLIFCAGNIDEVLANTNQGPFVVILHNSTGSKVVTVVLTVLVTLNLLFASVSQVATASRQLWSFARDGGLPYGKFFAVRIAACAYTMLPIPWS